MVARRLTIALSCLGLLLMGGFGISRLRGEEPAVAEELPAATVPDQAAEQAPAADMQARFSNEGLVRLAKDFDVWIDPKRKEVVVGGYVALREGLLEMFACPAQTKEHESVVAVNARAYMIHAALLAVGAKPGRPVRFMPRYEPATGTTIDIEVVWFDADGVKQRAAAQDWIKNVRTQEAMKHSWVFAGSMFWTDERTGVRRYLAEDGDLVCVSNFTTAMLDLPIPSSQSNDALMFTAFTERIPPLRTPVRLIFKPRLEAEGAGQDEAGGNDNAAGEGANGAAEDDATLEEGGSEADPEQ